jgi:SAM-dependent methyltransferase
LYDTDVVYHEIHGRRYCGNYFMPIDEDEQTRLEMTHTVYLYILNNRLTTAPLSNPTRILDIGSGTGEWAMAMGDEWPDAEVIGTDIAKIQPSAIPLNVFFEIDDAEEEGGWTFAKDSFDLIHFRSMVGAFTDWNHIYKEAFKHLKPGGWIENVDFDDHRALLTYFPAGSAIHPWLTDIVEAARRSGRPRGGHLEPEILTDLGFVDTSVEEYLIPAGIWPTDPEERKIGKLFLIAQLCAPEALCLRPLTEQMGWHIEDIQRMCGIVTHEFKEMAMDAKKAKGLGFKIRVLKGRKPDVTEMEKSPAPGRASASASTVGDDHHPMDTA